MSARHSASALTQTDDSHLFVSKVHAINKLVQLWHRRMCTIRLCRCTSQSGRKARPNPRGRLQSAPGLFRQAIKQPPPASPLAERARLTGPRGRAWKEAVIPDQTVIAAPGAAPSAREDGAPPVDILVPLYRRADLVAPLMAALAAMAAEIAARKGRVILINDSPDDTALAAALAEAGEGAGAALPLVLWVNDRNLGFVGAVNRGLAAARAEGHDALLLNSDALPTPGAFAEMRRVAYGDTMIGFVSPRSNNATLCSLPP